MLDRKDKLTSAAQRKKTLDLQSLGIDPNETNRLAGQLNGPQNDPSRLGILRYLGDINEEFKYDDKAYGVAVLEQLRPFIIFDIPRLQTLYQSHINAGKSVDEALHHTNVAYRDLEPRKIFRLRTELLRLCNDNQKLAIAQVLTRAVFDEQSSSDDRLRFVQKLNKHFLRSVFDREEIYYRNSVILLGVIDVLRLSSGYNRNFDRNSNGIYNLNETKELRLVLLENELPIDDLKSLFDYIEPLYDAASETEKHRLVKEISLLFSKSAEPNQAAEVTLLAHPSSTSRTLEGVSPEQLKAWRKVETIRLRAWRARLSPERADEQRAKAAEYAKGYRERLSPEQADAEREKAKLRMRAKRGQAKAPDPH